MHIFLRSIDVSHPISNENWGSSEFYNANFGLWRKYLRHFQNFVGDFSRSVGQNSYCVGENSNCLGAKQPPKYGFSYLLSYNHTILSYFLAK